MSYVKLGDIFCVGGVTSTASNSSKPVSHIEGIFKKHRIDLNIDSHALTLSEEFFDALTWLERSESGKKYAG
jgi:hypothetical protein